jgi:tartrate dehydratase beta subunit/fumarate hydratase class I family protein
MNEIDKDTCGKEAAEACYEYYSSYFEAVGACAMCIDMKKLRERVIQRFDELYGDYMKEADGEPVLIECRRKEDA